jgi:serine/threonine protein kinase
MEIMNLSQKKFASLERYELPKDVFNTEAKMYVLPIKNRWNTVNKILKRLYVTNGPMFGNKLQTINSLIDSREKIDIPEIVFPEKLASVNSEIVGYVMELVNSDNLATYLNSPDISSERKIKYLKQIGEILEKMSKVRMYNGVEDFYLNDIHENNFVVDKDSDSVRVVDIDSCKINENLLYYRGK